MEWLISSLAAVLIVIAIVATWVLAHRRGVTRGRVGLDQIRTESNYALQQMADLTRRAFLTMAEHAFEQRRGRSPEQ
jgi:hypothetical protein